MARAVIGGADVREPAIAGASSRRSFGLEDALSLRFVADAGLVPGTSLGWYGLSVVDVERACDVLTLWLFERADGTARQIAQELANPHGASPSPDGARLAFVAEVNGVAQVCSYAIERDVVEMLTDLPQGVTGVPVWSPDGNAIAFTAPPAPRRDPAAPYRVDRMTIGYEGVGIVDDALQEVFLLELVTGAVRRLTSDRAVHADPRWAPGGGRLLFRSSLAPDVEWTARPSLHVLDVASGERWLLVGDWGGVTAAEWCPDGERVVFCGARQVPGTLDPYDRKQDVWTVGAAGGEPVCHTAGVAAGVGTWLEFDHPTWSLQPRICAAGSGDAIYVSAQRGLDVAVCRVGLGDDEEVAVVIGPAGRACFLHDVDATDENLLYGSSTLLEPVELYLRTGGGERRLTRLNAAVVEELAQPTVVELEVLAPDGVRLEGRALTPPGEGPFPAVLCVHGGPNDAYGSAFMIDWHLLVGAGFAVVFSNFRGSGGYGDEFHGALDGRWGELGEPDHLATVDRAVELGIADPQRLGVYGLSHGGFAVCWLLGRTDRFRAGVAENPIVDFASAYATVDSPWWVEVLFGATPAEDPARYAERSPLTYAQGCRTPLLLVVGEEDRRCHPSQAEQYFRALKRNGCTTELLRLPGAGHLGSWSGPVPVRLAQDAALVDWFSRHLGGPAG